MYWRILKFLCSLLPAFSPAHAAWFEQNRGQAPDSVRRDAVLTTPTGSVRIGFSGNAAKPEVNRVDELRVKANYLKGSGPSRWRTGIPLFARVRYPNLYRGIDLVYHGTSAGSPEFDFVVGKGADPRAITISITSPNRVLLDQNGDLIPSKGADEVRLKRPVAYQEVRRPASGFEPVNRARHRAW